MSLADRDYYQPGRFTPPPPAPQIFSNIGRVTKTLLIINIVLWLVCLLLDVQDRSLYVRFLALNRHSAVHANIWQFITYMFLHINPWHLFFNLIVLFIFGRTFESMWGGYRFLNFYLVTGAGAGILSVPIFMIDYFHVTDILGASGAICGLLYAYGRYFPERKILVFFVFPVKMKYFIPGLILASFLFGLAGKSGIAHFTHLWGILCAFLYFKYYPRLMTIREKISQKQEAAAREERAKSQIQKNELYKYKIDPILKKISEKGMESLTPEEKKILESGKNRKD